MPVEVVSYMLSNKDIRMRIGFQLILQCAPFLKGIKVASITNVDRRHLKEFWRVLDGTGIDGKILTVSQMHGLYLPGGCIKRILATQGGQRISGAVWI